MNNDPQKIIKCISIRDAYLHNSTSYTADDFNPKYSDEVKDLVVQFKHMVMSADIRELDQDGENIKIFFVYIDFGVRWILFSGKSKKNIKAFIEATYVAEYKLEYDPDQKMLADFASKNASYHIWPYWREYITNQCVRMNLPKVILPIMQQAENRDSGLKKEE